MAGPPDDLSGRSYPGGRLAGHHESSREAGRALGARLRERGIVHALRGVAGPDRLVSEVLELEALARALAPDDRLLVELCLLGRSVDAASAAGALGGRAEDALRSAGILAVESGAVRMPAHALCASPWGWLLADPPLGTPGLVPRPARAFADDESLPICTRVARATSVPRALDLGCGAGLTMLAAARSAAEVVAIDVAADAVGAAWFAIGAAALEDRVDARAGDLYEPLDSGERFDRLIAVLPALPLPAGADAPAHAGGLGGSAISARAIREARRWLRDGADAWIGGALLFDGDRVVRTPILDALEECGGDVRWACGAAVSVEPASGALGRMLARDVAGESERWAAEIAGCFASLGATSFAPAVFVVRYP